MYAKTAPPLMRFVYMKDGEGRKRPVRLTACDDEEKEGDVEPLLDAMKQDKRVEIQALLGSGVNPNVLLPDCPRDGAVAVDKDKDEVAQNSAGSLNVFVSRIPGQTVFFKSMNVHQQYFLIQYGANVHHRDGYGRTPLHYVCRSLPRAGHRYLETDDKYLRIRGLLEAGADPNAVDKDGVTPFHCFCPYFSQEEFDLLRQFGAKIHLLDHQGRSALFHAGGNIKALAFLSKQGLHLQGTSKLGRTLLHEAIVQLNCTMHINL